MGALLPRAALYWFALTTVPFWLATIRGAFDGSSYQWGLFGHSGRGMGGDYWFPLISALIALVVMVSGWRGRGWAFVWLVLWNVLLFAAVVLLVRSSSEDIRFRGDTLGIDVSLALIGPAIFAVGLLLSLASALRAFQSTGSLAIVRPNNRWLFISVAALPLQFLLLRFGPNGSTADQGGVIITIFQWCFLGRSIAAFTATGPKPKA